MRAPMLAMVLVCAAAGAAAQTPYDDPSRYSPAQQAFEIAQRDSLYRQQEAQAAQARADAEARLNDLEAQRRAASDALDTPYIQSGAQIDAQLGADAARIDRLMEAAMARSNARVLAVKPVTR